MICDFGRALLIVLALLILLAEVQRMDDAAPTDPIAAQA